MEKSGSGLLVDRIYALVEYRILKTMTMIPIAAAIAMTVMGLMCIARRSSLS